MRELNIRFLEEYKTVDRYIRDAYKSEDGVTAYIRMMEADKRQGTMYVRTWNDDYYMLKHVRWVRNQLVHEVGYDSALCEKADYDNVALFHKRLYAGTDPISLLEKERRRIKREQAARAGAAGRKPSTGSSTGGSKGNSKNKKLSIWQRIVRFFTEP